MAAVRGLGKSGLLALVVFLFLDLQGADAQYNATCVYNETPRWAAATIGLLAVCLACYLLCCCLVPFCSGLCKQRDSCQSGCSFGK